jgi:hypothetical protein
MKKLLLSIGGYKIKFYKAANLSPKYLLPGISLVLVLITSTWGGYHLSEITKISFVSIGFVAFILLLDFSILHINTKKRVPLDSPQQENKRSVGWYVAIFTRLLVAIAAGSFISILTVLAIYKVEIESKLATNFDTELQMETMQYDKQINVADSLTRVYEKQEAENRRLAGRERYQGNREIGSPAGCGPEYTRYIMTAQQDSINSMIQKAKRDSLILNRASYEETAKAKIEEKQAKGLNGRITNLFAMAKEQPVTWFPIIAIFIILLCADMMPLITKIGKDELDEEYAKTVKNLKDEKITMKGKDENGDDIEIEADIYDDDRENYFLESHKAKVKMMKKNAKLEREEANLQIERQIEKAKSSRVITGINKMEEAKMKYIDYKFQCFINEINKRNTSFYPENHSQQKEKPSVNIEDIYNEKKQYFVNRVVNGKCMATVEDY